MHCYLTNIISQKVTLSYRDIELCNQYFESVLFPKNRIIEEEGKVPRYLYFIVSGFMRLFYCNDNGDEVTSHINCPPGFITSYFNFINQTKADVNLECITECELLRITKKDLDYLFQQSASFKDFSICVFQQSIAYNENRSKELATLTAEHNIIRLILKKEVPVETNITLNWIDVKDVAEGCYLAATKGIDGERYILANEQCISIKDTTKIAQALFPELKIKLPAAVPKPILYTIAWFMEIASTLNGKAPLLSVKDISMFSGLNQNFDISKAKKELGFNPKKPEIAVKEAMQYLRNNTSLVN